MKLRDFGKKPKSTNRPAKFVLQNDALENKYKVQIEDLNSQLGHYRRIEAERDEAMSKATALEDTLKSERGELDIIKESVSGLEKTIEDQIVELKKLPSLEEAARNSRGHSNSLQTDLEEMTNRAIYQSQEISLIKEELETLKNENKDLVKTTSEAVSLKQSTEADFEGISNKNKGLQSFTDKTSKINKELVEKNKSLIDLVNYTKVENKELLIQLEELQSVETKLRRWMGQMELKDSQTTSSKNSLENKVFTQQKVITDMSKTLDDMMKEMAFVRKLNKEYREELSRPKFMSMAAIASKEGFVMPNGKENIRTHNLGNYKPTMLKFKKKEEIKNGR